jgi:hypothetical protein
MTGGALRAVTEAVAAGCGIPNPRQPTRSIDWDEFIRLVDRHEVAPLAYRSGWLEHADAPAKVRSAVAERARADAMRSLRLLTLQREVVEAVAAAGIDGVVLKGFAAAIDAYEDLGARAPVDLDLLVSPRDVQRTVRQLQSLDLVWYGWRRPEDPDRPPVEPTAVARHASHPLLRDVTLIRGDLQVEVHWRLFENARLMPVDPAWLRAPRRVDAQGLALPTLPLDVHWIYLMVHGSKHQWSLMKWLADVAALTVRRPALARRASLETVADGYRRPVAAGLLIAEAVLGPFLMPESRNWATSVGGTRVLVRSALKALAAEHDRAKRVSPRALPGEIASRLSMRGDPRYRLDELRLLLLSAGRAHGVENPGIADLAQGPLRWARRSARRLAEDRFVRRGG